MNQPKISIVVPLYNEEDIFEFLVKRLNKLVSDSEFSIEILFIDDGSTDSTPTLIKSQALLDSTFSAIILSRNYGHQIALSAGLLNAKATDAVFIIDADLQDPPELLPLFYKKLIEGNDVVYGIRKDRKENFLKTKSYSLFYRIQKILTRSNIPLDTGDFSLISRRVVDILNAMPEQSKYIRGLRAWVGLNQMGVEYSREKRIAGKSKYNLGMLIRLAYNGIFNFTEIPIKFITNLGLVTFIISLGYFLITLIKRFIYGTVPEGFTGLLFTIILFSGVQLITIGIIGEYVVRIFFQTKGRPLFIVKEKIVNKHMEVKDL